MVRIMCYNKQYAAAEELVNRSGEPAAAFHLARQYESQGRIAESIRFYTMVGGRGEMGRGEGGRREGRGGRGQGGRGEGEGGRGGGGFQSCTMVRRVVMRRGGGGAHLPTLNPTVILSLTPQSTDPSTLNPYPPALRPPPLPLFPCGPSFHSHSQLQPRHVPGQGQRAGL